MKRKIDPHAMEFLSARIEHNTLAQQYIAEKKARGLFIEVTRSCVGIKETPSNQGVEVELFQKTVSLNKGDAWCMAFLQTCLAFTEIKTDTASPIFASGGCLDVWSSTPEAQRVVHIPLGGAIAIYQHLKTPGHGHTGMVIDCDGVSFHAIEGNVSEGEDNLEGRVGQSGEGVRCTHRRYDLFNPVRGDMKLLGCLKPF